jgi:hypothetical protein
MRKRHYLIVLVLLAGLVILVLLSKKPESSMLPSSADVQNQPPQAHPQQALPGITQTPSVAPALPHSRSHTNTVVVVEGVPVSEDVIRYVQSRKADPLYDWKQPINFYGKAVDENNQSVAGASVDYTWSTISTNGTLTKQGVTDGSGFFEIHETGKGISITVSKQGYYTTPSERLRSYEYANPGDGLFTPDPANPVLFHLRKKGTGVDLITSRYGASSTFPINIPRDGTPVMLDVMQRKIGNSGQIRISENKPAHDAWQQAKSWWFRMEIPDGGFTEQKDEFPFEAPESGYQPVVQFDFQQGQTNWATGLRKDFYVKFGNPPRYGRLQVQTDISYGGAIITYAINPDGSRNLESK